MKKIIIIFILFVSNVNFSQIKNVYVEYSVKIYDEKILFDTDPLFRKMFVEAMSNADQLSFGLVINNSGSKFYDKSIMSTSDDELLKISSTLFTDYRGVVFQYLNSIYSKSNSLGNDIMLKEPLKNNWELHNETKMIDSYLCYKATNVNIVDNGSGKIFRHPVIAWYCPQLPYNYGPNGYGNLPGLILELQVRNVVFGAKKIDLDSSTDFDNSFLSKVKTVSLEELNKHIDEEMESYKG